LTPESDGEYFTEQLLADAAIVHDDGDNVPVAGAASVSVNVSPGEPTAVHVAVVPNETLLGEQLSGARLAACALADPPSHATVTISAAITAGQAR
jgi:hypothetical protein